MKMTKEIWLARINLTLAMAKADGKHGVEVCVTPHTRDEMDELGVLDALPSSVVVTVMGELRGTKTIGMIIDELSGQANAAAAWPFPAALPGYNWSRKYPGEPKNSLDEGTRAVNPFPTPEEIKQAWKDHAAKVDEKACESMLADKKPKGVTFAVYRDFFESLHNMLSVVGDADAETKPEHLSRITIEVIE